MARAKIKRVLPKGKREKSNRKSTQKNSPEKQGEKCRDLPTDKPPGGKFRKGNTIGKEHYWKPGQSGNPKGKPKGIELTSSLKILLNQPLHEVPFILSQCERLGIDTDPKNKKVKVKDIIMAACLTQIIAGKSDLMKQVWERLEGSIKQTIHVVDDPFDDYLNAMRDKTSFDQIRDDSKPAKKKKRKKKKT